MPGQEWHLDEAAELLMGAGVVAPAIVVAIANAGKHRIDEYTPTRDVRHRAGGAADLYGRMLVEEIKPEIDRTYRTVADARVTGLCGSSLGGLVTLDLGLRYPRVFGRLAVMSPAVWWDRRCIVAAVNGLTSATGQRIWLDIGLEEGRTALRDARALRDALVAKGWRLGDDLAYLEAPGASHAEGAWAARVPEVLRFLYPPGTGSV